uniref:Transmembrane protein 134 n=1 Tax=Parastrongyloides trichosuri TaxID=131310 RepID=A0A0N4ZMB9_PARTI
MSHHFMGHSRNLSQGQHLIGTEHHDDEEDVLDLRLNGLGAHIESPRFYRPRPEVTMSPGHLQNYSTLSDGGSYYQPTNGVSLKNSQTFCCCCTNPYLKTNIRVVILSIFLTIFGLVVTTFGFVAMFYLTHIDLHGWLFVIVGILFFIPGCYHCVYIICALSGRPGYDFENLPTFKKPLV